MSFPSRYENFIGGQWVPPVKGQYFEAISSVNGQPFCEVARGTEADIEKALQKAKDKIASLIA
jgi:aldehyde dehydrogenase